MAGKEGATQTGALVKAQGAQLPAELQEEFLQDAGAGSSQAADDNIVPFLSLLQDMSPYVKKRDPEYIEGAEPGMWLNKATKQLYAGTPQQAAETGLPQLRFQHCAFDRCVVEWIPRNDGGGFVARHDLVGGKIEETMKTLGGRQVQDPQDPNKMNWKTSDGSHDLIDTRYHFGHILSDDGSVTPAVIGFSSTGHTSSREWMTLINNFKIKAPDGRILVAPAWAKAYTIGSKSRENKKGSFFVATVVPGDVIADAGVRQLGKALNQAVGSGAVRAADDEDASGSGDAAAEIAI